MKEKELYGDEKTDFNRQWWEYITFYYLERFTNRQQLFLVTIFTAESPVFSSFLYCDFPYFSFLSFLLIDHSFKRSVVQNFRKPPFPFIFHKQLSIFTAFHVVDSVAVVFFSMIKEITCTWGTYRFTLQYQFTAVLLKRINFWFVLVDRSR